MGNSHFSGVHYRGICKLQGHWFFPVTSQVILGIISRQLLLLLYWKSRVPDHGAGKCGAKKRRVRYKEGSDLHWLNVVHKSVQPAILVIYTMYRFPPDSTQGKLMVIFNKLRVLI